MKRLLVLIFNTLWFFFAWVSLAHAGPIAAAIGAVASIFAGAGGLGAALLKIVLGIALNVAGSLLQKALQKDQKQQAQGVKLDVQMGDDYPMSFILGTYATAGKRKYIGTWGKVDDTPNAFLVDVIELASIPNYAGFDGLNSVWVDESNVTIEWDNPHEDGRGYPVTQYRKNSKDYLWIKFYDGTQTVSDPYVLAKFGADERPYSDEMVGRGCQYVIVTCRFNRKLFKNGLPKCVFEPKPIPLYDIRKDTTMGGSGSQRWDDPSTWGGDGDNNNAIMIYNVVRGIYYGDEWVYGGQLPGAHRIPPGTWMAAANECDRLIEVSDDLEERQFRGGLEIEVSMEPLEIIDQLRLGCAGRLAEVGGALKLLVGAPGGAVYSFTDENVVITEGQSFEPFPSLASTHNGIEGTYPEPEEKWSTKDAPPRYSDDLEEEDGNRRLLVGVQFAATPYRRQVQRLMRTMIQEERRFRTHQFYLPPDAWVLEPNDVIAWTSARMGYSNKKFIIVTIAGAQTFCQLVTIRELDPTDYGWSISYEIPANPVELGPTFPPAQVLTGWSVSPWAIPDSAGTPRRPAIKITVGADFDDVSDVRVQVRVALTGDLVFDRKNIEYDAPYEWILAGDWCLPNTEYEVRGILIPFTRRDMEWSAWLTVTTPDILIAEGDILDGAITSAKIAEAAVTAEKLMNEAVTSIKLADAAVTTAKLEVGAVTEEILALGAVTTAKFAAGITPVEIVTSLPTTDNFEGRQAFFEGKLYRFTDGDWVTGVDAEDIVGEIVATEIADGSVTTPKLAANAVTTAKLAAGAVTANEIAANTITAGQIAAGAIGATEIAALSIQAKHLVLSDFSNILPDNDLTIPTQWIDASDIPAEFSIEPGTSFENAIRTLRMVTPASLGGTANGYYGGVFTPYFPVEAGKPYTFGGTMRTQSTGLYGTWQFELIPYDQAGTALAGLRVDAVMTGTTAEQPLSGTLTMPATAVTARFRLRRARDASGNVGGTVYAYNMFVRRSANAELIVDGSIIAGKIAAGAVVAGTIAADAVTTSTIAASAITGAKIAANTITGDKIVSNTITARQIVVTDFENMILDGFFDLLEQDAMWTFFGGTYTQLDTSGEFRLTTTTASGQYAMVLDRKDATTGPTLSMRTVGYQPVESGSTLTWEIVTRTTTGEGVSPSGTYFRIYWYDSTFTELSFTDVISNGPIQTSFTTYSGKIAVPSTAKYVRARVYLNNGATSKYLIVDRISLRKAKGAELIVDGTIVADHLAANTITASKIAARTITASRLVLNGITFDEILNNTISNVQLAFSDTVVGVAAADGYVQMAAITCSHGDTSGKILIDCNAVLQDAGAGTYRINARLVDDTGGAGDILMTVANVSGINGASIVYMFTPPSGRTSTVFRFYIDSINGSSDTMNFRGRTIRTTALKR